MKALIALAAEGKDLSEAQAETAMSLIMNGEATPAQVAAFLMAMRIKGETVAEITGCARVMRDKAAKVQHHRPVAVDTCGTGGDRSNTFNISTTAAFVVAGCGVAVAKHGNRAASSLTGSADVLEALGVRLDLTPSQVGQCIDEVGIGFLYAPAVHTSMKNVAAVRRDIGTQTIFNLLGPLTNPSNALAQVMGVFRANLTEPLARVLGNLGCRHALVVHGADGLDEISISAPTVVSEVVDGFVHTYRIVPEDFGIQRAPREFVRGGVPAENAKITESILNGETGPRRDVVLLNAAAALMAADRVKSLKEGIAMAAESIDSGEARRTLEGLRHLTHKLAAVAS